MTFYDHEIDNMPVYKVFSIDDEIVLKYTFEDDDFYGFGPYTPYKMIPFFIIWGEGLPPNSAFFVQCERTIEGVVYPTHDEFTNPKRANNDQAEQRDSHEHVD